MWRTYTEVATGRDVLADMETMRPGDMIEMPLSVFKVVEAECMRNRVTGNRLGKYHFGFNTLNTRVTVSVVPDKSPKMALSNPSSNMPWRGEVDDEDEVPSDELHQVLFRAFVASRGHFSEFMYHLEADHEIMLIDRKDEDDEA